MPAKFLTVVVSAFVLFVCLADAEVYEIPLECPFCSQEFNGLQSGDTEYNAGIDSDFCPYSLTGSTRSFQVQTCPHCGYSAYTQRFLAEARAGSRCAGR
ncbi:MAG: DUF2225 domain-containing protein [Planctomycetota bacterium]|nr:DUF2225 domain-containing protein [Planctomycetota bacterium]